MGLPICVENLSKTYKIPIRPQGLWASLVSLARPQYRQVQAVKGISFAIDAGEMVGFIGPNGAGKTTTLKMLAGLLYPSAGRVEIGGFIPSHRSREYLERISLVMGNKSQLTWDNTVQDCFYIHKQIYGVTDNQYRIRLQELVDLLEISDLLAKQARNLSLGERAKCQLAMALLHQPDVLFLDEPTLGLDVSMQLRFRSFLKEYCRHHNTTVLLTSHYMGDIVSLCSRVILINQGTLGYDGDLSALAAKASPFKLLEVVTKTADDHLNETHIQQIGQRVPIVEQNGRSVTFRLPKKELVAVVNELLAQYPMADLNISDPPIEAVIDQIYQGGIS